MNTTHIEQSLSSRRLRQAITQLRAITPANAWRISAEIDRIEADYARMLEYALTGHPDPGREQMYAALTGALYTVLDRIIREDKAKDSPTLYFNTMRYERMQTTDTIPALLAAYRAEAAKHSLFSQASGRDKGSAKEAERLENRIFNRIWTTSPLTAEDAAALSDAWVDATLPEHFGPLTVSALMLAAMEYFDERTLLLLLDATTLPQQEMQVRATAAALMAMCMHPNRTGASAKVANRVAALRESGTWSADVRMMLLQFIRSRDTDRITRRMRDEIMPEMMKLRSDIFKKIQSPEDMATLDENPEWEEFMERSGLTDKLKELTELQSDGADVFMSTFSALKHFPFFSDLSHWFLPFHTSRSEVQETLGHDTTLADLMALSPFICSSDKYSMIFAMAQLGDAQKQLMLSQIQAQNVNMAELSQTELIPAAKQRENMANKTVQDIYRFFKLFRRKGEFADPFDGTRLNLVAIPLLTPDLNQPETLLTIGEFYFSRGFYAEALEILRRLPADATIWQKIGYAAQKLGMNDEALRAYEQAELLTPDSLWTLRRLAALLRQTGQTQRALDYYRRIEQKRPDEIATVLNIGHCLLELGEYREALHSYYKAEFMDETSTRPFRPIAWSALLLRDYDTAGQYYDRLLSAETPSAADYLNMGHLQVARRNYREALNYYRLYISSDQAHSVDTLREAIAQDTPLLIRAGIDATIFPLLLDSI